MNALAERTRFGITAKYWSRRLGYAGLLPFLPAFALPWLDSQPLAGVIQHAVLSYGAVILSFVGALHWQAALHVGPANETTVRLGFSVVPALLGWTALLLQPAAGFALLIAGFLAAYGFDRRWRRGETWFLQLRLYLTVAAVLSLTVALGTSLFAW